jgi:hypothetical protein
LLQRDRHGPEEGARLLVKARVLDDVDLPLERREDLFLCGLTLERGDVDGVISVDELSSAASAGGKTVSTITTTRTGRLASRPPAVRGGEHPNKYDGRSFSFVIVRGFPLRLSQDFLQPFLK